MESNIVLWVLCGVLTAVTVVLLIYSLKFKKLYRKKSKMVDVLFKQNSALHKRLIDNQQNKQESLLQKKV